MCWLLAGCRRTALPEQPLNLKRFDLCRNYIIMRNILFFCICEVVLEVVKGMDSSVASSEVVKGMDPSVAKLFDISNFHGNFCAGGKCFLPTAPGILILGRIPVPLPIVPSFIKRIKSRAKKRNAEMSANFVSCGVEIGAKAVSMSNVKWESDLKNLVEEVFETFSIPSQDASFELIKLTFEESTVKSKLKSDNTKISPNQFGFLEIQFPSIFAGGSHTIRHKQFESNFTMGVQDSSCRHECYFAAWYIGCQHARQSLRRGCRLIATYSLLWTGAGPVPKVPHMRAVDQLAKALANSTSRYAFFLNKDALSFRGLRRGSSKLVRLLTATSARMEQESPGNALELHICTAAVIEQDNEVQVVLLRLLLVFEHRFLLALYLILAFSESDFELPRFLSHAGMIESMSSLLFERGPMFSRAHSCSHDTLASC